MLPSENSRIGDFFGKIYRLARPAKMSGGSALSAPPIRPMQKHEYETCSGKKISEATRTGLEPSTTGSTGRAKLPRQVATKSNGAIILRFPSFERIGDFGALARRFDYLYGGPIIQPSGAVVAAPRLRL